MPITSDFQSYLKSSKFLNVFLKLGKGVFEYDIENVSRWNLSFYPLFYHILEKVHMRNDFLLQNYNFANKKHKIKT